MKNVAINKDSQAFKIRHTESLQYWTLWRFHGNSFVLYPAGSNVPIVPIIVRFLWCNSGLIISMSYLCLHAWGPSAETPPGLLYTAPPPRAPAGSPSAPPWCPSGGTCPYRPWRRFPEISNMKSKILKYVSQSLIDLRILFNQVYRRV